MIEREYAFGIYYFIDTWKDEIAYIGLDSHIDRRQRIKDHYQESRYKEQSFNRVLQKNPERFKPIVYCECNTHEEMSQLEFDLINLYRPRFNYKHGGNEQSLINKEFKYTIAKTGVTSNKKQVYTIYDMNHKRLKRSIDFEFLQDICLKLNNNEITEEEVKKFKYTIAKLGFTSNKKQLYTIYDMNNKRLKSSVDFEFLEDICLKLNNNELIPDDVKNINKKDYLEKISKCRESP